MTDRLIDKFVKQHAAAGQLQLEADSTDTEDRGCFGWLRGIRDRAIMLELRKTDGHVLAIGYAWLERVEFEPETGITLYLPGRKVRITGSGLNSETRPTVRLFDGIIRHRVPWIRESNRSESLITVEDAALVEQIQWDD
jgi:hypothetical protein